MRNGQNKRMRGRNRKNHNPMSRVYESNGPDVKIRGTPSHIAEKYIQLARDAQASGDPVSAENYYQHAEHYYRLIAAAQEQFRQNNPQFYRPENELPAGARDDVFDDDDDEAPGQQGEAPFGTREPQPYLPREAQHFQNRDHQQPHQQHQPHQPHQQHQSHQQHQPHQQRHPQQHQPHQQHAPRPLQDGAAETGEVAGLPSFITGGQSPQQGPQGQGYQGQPHQNHQGYGQNGHDNHQGDRFPLHRRRRRHRGPRPDMQGGPPPGMGSEDRDNG